MSEDIFAGILGGNFGDTIEPEDLITALIEHGFVRADDSRTQFIVLKEFTVYGRSYRVIKSTNVRVRRRFIEDCYRKCNI